MTLNCEQSSIKSDSKSYFGTASTVTSCPFCAQYFAKLYGRNDAIEFFGGKYAATIRIFINLIIPNLANPEANPISGFNYAFKAANSQMKRN